MPLLNNDPKRPGQFQVAHVQDFSPPNATTPRVELGSNGGPVGNPSLRGSWGSDPVRALVARIKGGEEFVDDGVTDGLDTAPLAPAGEGVLEPEHPALLAARTRAPRGACDDVDDTLTEGASPLRLR